METIMLDRRRREVLDYISSVLNNDMHDELKMAIILEKTLGFTRETMKHQVKELTKDELSARDRWREMGRRR